MLKVWRGKQGLFAECTSCGSYGTANHLQLRQKMTPEVAEALERHTAHMMALRSHFEAAAKLIAAKTRTGELTRPQANEKVQGLYANHVAQVQLGAAGLPSLEGKVTELALNCPWCSVVEEVELKVLPDDKVEPDFELAKERAAFNADAKKKAKGN